MNERDRVLKALEGQPIVIKGLRKSFAEWPFETNPNLEQIRQDVDNRLIQLFADHPKLTKLRAGDYGLFGATWFPRANLRVLRVATYLIIWLFMWDDELDMNDGLFTYDWINSQQFRKETADYIQSSLGFASTEPEAETTNDVIKSFEDIGAELSLLLSRDQKKVLMKEVLLFMEMSEVEQRIKLSDRVPDVVEFWQYRMGTSAVRIVLAVNELCVGSQLPSYVISNSNMGCLWNLVNVNICLVNDLLSVKKELAGGSVDSLIPILFAANTKPAQEAVDTLMDLIRHEIHTFDITATYLLNDYKNDEAVSRDLEAFIDGCKFFMTGNLSWSLCTARYKVGTAISDDELRVIL